MFATVIELFLSMLTCCIHFLQSQHLHFASYNAASFACHIPCRIISTRSVVVHSWFASPAFFYVAAKSGQHSSLLDKPRAMCLQWMLCRLKFICCMVKLNLAMLTKTWSDSHNFSFFMCSSAVYHCIVMKGFMLRLCFWFYFLVWWTAFLKIPGTGIESPFKGHSVLLKNCKFRAAHSHRCFVIYCSVFHSLSLPI